MGSTQRQWLYGCKVWCPKNIHYLHSIICKSGVQKIFIICIKYANNIILLLAPRECAGEPSDSELWQMNNQGGIAESRLDLVPKLLWMLLPALIHILSCILAVQLSNWPILAQQNSRHYRGGVLSNMAQQLAQSSSNMPWYFYFPETSACKGANFWKLVTGLIVGIAVGSILGVFLLPFLLAVLKTFWR